MMIKFSIYVAAPFSERGKMPEIASKLEGMGHTISHKWWEVEEDETEKSPIRLREIAELDTLGVVNAHLLLLINSNKSEGKAVEQGLAIAMGKPILAVGKRGEFSKNVFHYMVNYDWVPDLDTAYTIIEGLSKGGDTDEQ